MNCQLDSFEQFLLVVSSTVVVVEVVDVVVDARIIFSTFIFTSICSLVKFLTTSKNSSDSKSFLNSKRFEILNFFAFYIQLTPIISSAKIIIFLTADLIKNLIFSTSSLYIWVPFVRNSFTKSSVNWRILKFVSWLDCSMVEFNFGAVVGMVSLKIYCNDFVLFFYILNQSYNFL